MPKHKHIDLSLRILAGDDENIETARVMLAARAGDNITPVTTSGCWAERDRLLTEVIEAAQAAVEADDQTGSGQTSLAGEAAPQETSQTRSGGDNQLDLFPSDL